MQGSRAADGTAWALRIIEWPVPQVGAEAPRFSAAGRRRPLLEARRRR